MIKQITFMLLFILLAGSALGQVTSFYNDFGNKQIQKYVCPSEGYERFRVENFMLPIGTSDFRVFFQSYVWDSGKADFNGYVKYKVEVGSKTCEKVTRAYNGWTVNDNCYIAFDTALDSEKNVKITIEIERVSSCRSDLKSGIQISGSFYELEQNSPNVKILYPNNTLTSNNISHIEYNISDDSGFKRCYYTLNSITENINCSSNIANITPSEGINNLTVYAEDVFGMTGNASVIFTYDTTNPVLSIHSPQGNQGREVLFNVSANENLSNAYVLINDMNFPLSKFGNSYSNTFTLENGFYNAEFYGFDLAGNSANTSINFTVSSNQSGNYISFISPENKTYNTNNILININASSSNVIWSNGTSNFSYFMPANFIFSEGTHRLTAYLVNSSGIINSTSVNFYVSSTNDSVLDFSIISPISKVYKSSGVFFKIEANKALNKSWVVVDGENTTLTKETDRVFSKTISLSNDDYTATFYAIDLAGNMLSKSVSFEVDKTVKKEEEEEVEEDIIDFDDEDVIIPGKNVNWTDVYLNNGKTESNSYLVYLSIIMGVMIFLVLLLILLVYISRR